MALKTLVKVSEVNNLSDARYCAGMGVEMIGFSLDENHPKFIELSKLREISSWISGVKVVGEFTGDNIYNMNYLADLLALDYIQLNTIVHPEFIPGLKKPVILRVLFEGDEAYTLKILEQYKSKVEFFILETEKLTDFSGYEKFLQTVSKDYKIIIGFGIEHKILSKIIDEIKPAGIGLKGGEEIKPGLNEFASLAEILEELEVED